MQEQVVQEDKVMWQRAPSQSKGANCPTCAAKLGLEVFVRQACGEVRLRRSVSGGFMVLKLLARGGEAALVFESLVTIGPEQPKLRDNCGSGTCGPSS